jgi:hypothetical protein
VDPATLSSLERDLLKDALAVVKRFARCCNSVCAWMRCEHASVPVAPLPLAGGLAPPALLRQLADPALRLCAGPGAADEWVSLDCETTGLDVRRDDIVSIGGAHRGQRILTSQRLELLVRPPQGVVPTACASTAARAGSGPGPARSGGGAQLLHFIGSRPWWATTWSSIWP